MAVTCAYVSQMTITETLTRSESTNPAITYDKLNTGLTLNATSSPAITKQASFNKAMSAGAATIDLTSITPQNEATVTMNGLKVQAFKFKAPATNSGAITITTGASNGLALCGSGWSLTISPGQEVQGYLAAASITVDSTHKTLDMSGTGTDSLDIQLVAG